MKKLEFFFFFSENFHFLEVKFSVYLNRHVFVMLEVQLKASIKACVSLEGGIIKS